MSTRPLGELRIAPPRPEAGRLRLSAELHAPNGARDELWYEIDEYAQGALVDSADPFVTAFLPLAMRRGHDLRVVGGGVSPSLVENLARFQEVWHAWHGLPIVSVVADEEHERAERPGPAVTSFSGGVDSAFTAWRHTRGTAPRGPKLTAALMLHGVDIPIANVVGFTRSAARSRRMLDSLGLDLVTVRTNVFAVAGGRDYPIAAGLASGFHLLGARFGTGLVPSTTSYRHLVFPLGSSPVSDALLGSDRLEVVHDGAGDERFDKIAQLATWDEALDSLRVCLSDPQHHRNCGRCVKCMMLLLTFRVLGVTPRCFDTPPSDDEILAWIPSLPSRPLDVQDAWTLVEQAARRGIDEPWTRALRRKLLVIRTKEAVRRGAPAWSARVTDVHRRVARALRSRRGEPS